MSDEQISPNTGRPYPSLPTLLRDSFGPTLPPATNLDELCDHATAIPTLLDEILDGASSLIDQGHKRVDVRTVAFRRIAELQRWLPKPVHDVLASLNGHPQFGDIYEAVEEVRTCADVLCKLAYDRVRTPNDIQATRRYVEAGGLVQGSVDALRPLAGLRPLPSGNANPGRHNSSDRDAASLPHAFVEAVRPLASITDIGGVLRPYVIEWIDARTTRIRQRTKWRRALLHCAKRALKKPRLRDEEAGPPHPGWVFENDLYPRLGGAQVIHDSGVPAAVGAWVPPRLMRANEPQIDELVPLPRRALTEIETCTLVAALIDAAEFGGVEKIGQFDGDDGTAVLRRTEWGFIVKNVRTLEEERDGGAVAAAVKVARDLLKPPTDEIRISADHKTVTFRGRTDPLTEPQARVLSRIVGAGGRWITSDELREFPKSSERPDRIIKGLPEAIRSGIESKTGTGYRWTLT